MQKQIFLFYNLTFIISTYKHLGIVFRNLVFCEIFCRLSLKVKNNFIFHRIHVHVEVIFIYIRKNESKKEEKKEKERKKGILK